MEKYIDIVFDGPPGPVSGRYVEVVDESGRSISVGRWLRHDDGNWALRIDLEAENAAVGKLAAVASVLPDIYASEINFSLTTFWDGGFDAKLGDYQNGFVANGNFDTFIDAVEHLRDWVVKHRPDSEFARKHRKATSTTLRTQNAADAYHNYMAAEREVIDALGGTAVGESGWLIEHPDTTQSVRYLTLHQTLPSFWTGDHLLALRFARQQDAADFQNYFAPIEGEGGKIVEHAWD